MHPASILATTFSGHYDVIYFKNTGKREKLGKYHKFNFVDISLFPFMSVKKKKKRKKEKITSFFEVRHLRFLFDFDLILVHMPLMCSGKLHIFTYGKKSLTMA